MIIETPSGTARFARRRAAAVVSLPHLLLGLLGMATSYYAVVVHAKVKAGQDAGCGLSETINCNDVLASSYAEVLHIPLGVYGLVFFAIMMVLAFNTEAPRQAAAWRLALASLGLLGSVTLTFISLVYIHAACPVCLSTHAVVLALFLVSLVQFLKARSL